MPTSAKLDELEVLIQCYLEREFDVFRKLLRIKLKALKQPRSSMVLNIAISKTLN